VPRGVVESDRRGSTCVSVEAMDNLKQKSVSQSVMDVLYSHARSIRHSGAPRYPNHRALYGANISRVAIIVAFIAARWRVRERHKPASTVQN
jgi:hypothetical protein